VRRDDDVVLSKQRVVRTDQCFADNGRSAWASILEVAAGRAPQYVANRDVLATPRFRERLRGYGERAARGQTVGGS